MSIVFSLMYLVYNFNNKYISWGGVISLHTFIANVANTSYMLVKY